MIGMKKKLMILLLITGFIFTGCNRQIIDTSWNFNKAKIIIGTEVIEVDVKQWKDYEDTTIQIISEDGKVYLTDLKNVILIKE